MREFLIAPLSGTSDSFSQRNRRGTHSMKSEMPLHTSTPPQPPHRLAPVTKTILATTACIIALAFVIVPVLFLWHYQTHYGFDPAVVHFGWLLVACFVVSSYTAILLLASLSSSSRDMVWAGLFTGFLSLSGIAIGLIYLSAYLSNSAWGDTITYDIAAAFAGDPGALLDILPFSTKGKTVLVVPILGALAVLVFGAYRLSRFLSNQLFLRVTGWLRPGPNYQARRRRVLATFGPLGVTVLTLVLVLNYQIQRAPERLVGEPVSSFLKWFPSADTLHMDSYRLQSALDDRAVRASYPKTAAFSRKNVVLILADSLRADRMGVYGYSRDTTPFLSWLSGQGLLHRADMALSTCSESYCGISSTLASHPFHQVSDKSLKLHSLLKDVGYRINFFISGDHRAWKYLREFYGNDIDVFYDHVADKRFPIDDDRKILAGLQQVAPFSGQPNFFYLFLMSSHVAGTRYPEYERYSPDKFDGILSFWNEVVGTQRRGTKVSARDTFEPSELTIFSNHYDNGVLQADAMIANIFAMLEDKGYLKDSVVVILGDHGDGLGEHGHLGHTRYLYQEDIRIPLLIYDRNASVYRDGRFATQIDIAPTVIDRLGLPVPDSWQGRSLLRPPEERVTLHQTRRGANICRAVVSDLGARLFKYIRCGVAHTDRSEELYDLSTDPHERTNLLETVQPQLLARLRREIDSRFALTTNRCDSFECVD